MGLGRLAAAILHRVRGLTGRERGPRTRNARELAVLDRVARDRAIGYDAKTMDDMQRAGGWPGTR